jgi:hypothetical protein
MNLRLAVKSEYFNQILSGIKTEEYRLANSYWGKRLVARQYETITITNGYPKKGDKDREITFKYSGYNIIWINHKHFGNLPQMVYSIKLKEQKQ